MYDIRELTSDELAAVSGGKKHHHGVGGLLGQIEDLLTGSEASEKGESKEPGVIERIEQLLGIK